jgi:hypothetical protein
MMDISNDMDFQSKIMKDGAYSLDAVVKGRTIFKIIFRK